MALECEMLWMDEEKYRVPGVAMVFVERRRAERPAENGHLRVCCQWVALVGILP